MTSRGWAAAGGCAALVGAGLLAAGRGVRRKYGHPPRRHGSVDPGRVPPAALDVNIVGAGKWVILLAKDRVDGKEDGVTCVDWFFCTREFSAEQIDTAIKAQSA